MRRKQSWITRAVIGALAALLATVAISGANHSPSALDLFPTSREGTEFQNPRFSPDGRWLAFDQCERKLTEERCRNVIYDRRNDRYISWRDANGRPITDVSFSEDGTKAVFVVETSSPFLGFGRYENRIAIADIRKSSYHFITSGPGAKRHPEFWKGGAVIYVGTEPEDTGRRKSKYLYIVGSGKPRKLMETEFYGPSRARPHWDGEQILMSEFRFTDEAQGSQILSVRPADGSIAVIDPQPSPDYRRHFFGPVVARIAKNVHIKAILNKESNQPQAGFRYDVFVLDGMEMTEVSKLESAKVRRRVRSQDVYVVEGISARRVSWFASRFNGMDVTEDGRYLALVTADTSKRDLRDFRLLIYDPQTRAHRELQPNDIRQQTFHQMDE